MLSRKALLQAARDHGRMEFLRDPDAESLPDFAEESTREVIARMFPGAHIGPRVLDAALNAWEDGWSTAQKESQSP